MPGTASSSLGRGRWRLNIRCQQAFSPGQRGGGSPEGPARLFGNIVMKTPGGLTPRCPPNYGFKMEAASTVSARKWPALTIQTLKGHACPTACSESDRPSLATFSTRAAPEKIEGGHSISSRRRIRLGVVVRMRG